MVLKALLGPHPGREEDYLIYKMILKGAGYKEIDTATSAEQMLEKLGVEKDSSYDSPPANHYDFILMELNQGSPNDKTYEPALKVYRHVEADVRAGRTKFIAISGNRESIEGAKSQGIKALEKGSFRFQDIMA